MTKKIRGKPKPLPSKSELKQLYVKERKSIRNIGKMYFVDPIKIRNLLVEHGIKIIPRGSWALGLTKETHSGIRKIAESKTGVARTHETIRKIRESGTLFKNGHTPWIKGKHHSEETKALLSKANMGNIPGNKGKKGPPSPFKGETKKTNLAIMKRSISATGKKRTPETKKKMSKAQIENLQKHPELKANLILYKKGRIPHNKGLPASKELNEKNRLAHLGQIPHNKGVPRNQWMSAEGEKRVRNALQETIVPSKDTRPEKMLQEALDKRGIDYQKHITKLIGKPDIFIHPSLCIFVDGDFTHANPDSTFADGRKKYLPNTVLRKPYKNRPALIAREVREKDKRITKELEKQGFQVLRFWEMDIRKNTDVCIMKILKFIMPNAES